MQTSKRKFCFVLPHFFKEYQGGAELQSYYLGKELIKRGWEVHYIREREKATDATENVDGFILHAVQQRPGYLRWRNAGTLAKIMHSIKADVWYIRGTKDYIPLVVNAAKKTGGKTVWACSRDSQLAYFHIKSRKHLIGYFINNFTDLFAIKALPAIDSIILQTHHQQELLKRRFKLNGDIIQNAHPFNAATNGSVTERESLVLWISRLQPWKHPELFVDLARRFKNTPIRFMAMGKKFNQELEDIFVAADKELNNFTFLGEQKNEDVLNLLSRSKLLVNTSENEGFSNTFIEAWLRGVPIISYQIDPDEIISRNNLGKACKGQFEDFVKAVENILDKPEEWRGTSLHCIEYAKKNFLIESAVDKLEEIITKLNG